MSRGPAHAISGSDLRRPQLLRGTSFVHPGPQKRPSLVNSASNLHATSSWKPSRSFTGRCLDHVCINPLALVTQNQAFASPEAPIRPDASLSPAPSLSLASCHHTKRGWAQAHCGTGGKSAFVCGKHSASCVSLLEPRAASLRNS